MTIRSYLIAPVAVGLLAMGCASQPPARSPIAPPARPVVTAPAPRPMAAKPVSPSTSQIAISDEIRAACGIPDEDAYFAFDSARIREQDQRVLGQVATCFNTGPLKGRNMLLVGRADPRGSAEYNMVLGEHRAQSVGQYLSTLGLASHRMETSSRGKMDAMGTNEATWALDRRVDVDLVPAPLGCGPNGPAAASKAKC
jgi:peptidoglycan-associated lipoprotein